MITFTLAAGNGTFSASPRLRGDGALGAVSTSPAPPDTGVTTL